MATEIQVKVSDALQKLKLELEPPDVIGGPRRLRATDEAVEFIQSLIDDGKIVVVDFQGNVTFAEDEDIST
jgi:hypothetical protein